MGTNRLVAVFDSEEQMLEAGQAVKDAGFLLLDAYTPYAVHGASELLSLRRSRLTWVCFFCGAAAVLLAFWFQFWVSAVDWPIDVGGKPWNSWPAFAPVAFELMVLCAGVGVVLALFARCKLFPGKTPYLPAKGITDDKFVLLIGGGNPLHDLHEAKMRCLLHSASHVEMELAEG